MLASWPDERLRQAVIAVEAGNRNDTEGWEERSWDRFPGVEVFEVVFLRDELARRGWAPLREGPA